MNFYSSLLQAEPKNSVQKGVGLAMAGIFLLTALYFIPRYVLKADLTEEATVGNTPVYLAQHAGSGSGLLNIRLKEDLTFDAIAFDLAFPAESIIFPSNAIVLDDTTLIQPNDVDIKLTSARQDQVNVIMLLSQPISSTGIEKLDKNTHPILFKLAAEISNTVSPGQQIDLEVSDFVFYNGSTDLKKQMRAEDVIFNPSNSLEIDYAEVLPDEKIVLHMNDSILDFGQISDYEILLEGKTSQVIPVSRVQSGSDFGYGQNAIVLTGQDALVPDQQYTVRLLPSVLGETKGAVAPPKDLAVVNFPAYFSSTKVESLVPTDFTSFELTFNKPIDASTLTPASLELFTFNDPNDLTQQKTLTPTRILTQGNNTYRVELPSSSGSGPYFLRLLSVEDAQGDLVANQAMHAFDPSVLIPPEAFSITPSIKEAGGNVLISGTALDEIQGVELGNTSIPFTGTASTLNLTIPANLSVGDYAVTLIWSGGSINAGPLKVVSDSSQAISDVSQDPAASESLQVLEEEAYTTPQTLLNDGETAATLFVPIHRGEGEITQVVANLASIKGQQGVAMQDDLNETSPASDLQANDSVCTRSPQLPCLELAFREGKVDWYILKNMTVPSSTLARKSPYYIDVIVSDDLNQTTTGSLPVSLGNSFSQESFEAELKAVAVVSTSPTTLEIAFNQALDPKTLSEDHFMISQSNDPENTLSVLEATIGHADRVVSLTTADQLANQTYVLTFNEELVGHLGQSLVSSQADPLSFQGYEASGQEPLITFIEGVDGNRVDLEFDTPLKPSTFPFEASDLNQIQIYQESNKDPLRILDITLIDSQAIRILTQEQRLDQRYVVELSNMRAYDETVGRFKMIFKGSPHSSAKPAAQTGDFNTDGVVDFTDFTLFSTLYGKKVDL